MVIDEGGHKVREINHYQQNNEINQIFFPEKEFGNQPDISNIKNDSRRKGMRIELVEPMLVSSESVVQIKRD